MKKTPTTRSSARAVCLFSALCLSAPCWSGESDWASFRGPGGWRAPQASPPTTWSIEEGINVAWAVELPGRGVSGPIVVDDRVVVTSSDGPNRERLHVVCYDANTSDRLWSRRLWATGRSFCHETSANAAPTPASDGERVFAFFSSNDLAAIGLDGRVHWVRGLYLDHEGVGNDVGMASSPAVVGDAVVVQAECQANSFAIAVDRVTGKTLWQRERPRSPNWTSPLPGLSDTGAPAVWLTSSEGATLHDATTGEQLAEIAADCGSIASASLTPNGLLVLPSGGVTLFRAPFTDASEPLLRATKLQPGSPSPVVWRDRVLVVNQGGVLTAGDLSTGEVDWRHRLGGRYWATPVVADGRAYCVSSSGEATVVDLNNRGAVLAEADFGEDILATPAVAGDAIYFRGNSRLWKISEVRQAKRDTAPHGVGRLSRLSQGVR